MLKSDYEGVKKLMKQVHQLHYVNRPDIFLDGDALSKSYFGKLFHDEYFCYVYVKDDEIVGLLMMEHHVKPGYEVVNDRNVFYISDLVVMKIIERVALAVNYMIMQQLQQKHMKQQVLN